MIKQLVDVVELAVGVRSSDTLKFRYANIAEGLSVYKTICQQRSNRMHVSFVHQDGETYQEVFMPADFVAYVSATQRKVRE